jgi:hypothetical protein
MNDQSQKSSPETLPDTPSAISSPESADGATPCDSLDGPIADLFGQALAPVSPSALLVGEKDSPMNATYGLSGESLSASDALQSCLENRLRQRLNGSVLCEVIWKQWISPWGRSLFKPRARVRSITEIDISLWATAKAADGRGNPYPKQLGDRRSELRHQVWPTPQARDHFPAHTPEYIAEKKAQGHGMSNLNDVVSTWPTPTRGMQQGGCNARPANVKRIMAGETKRPSGAQMQVALEDLSLATVLNGSLEPMEKLGQLNPEFVCWLMGFPREWDACAPTATPSSRKSQRNS